jgi:hypothetical protein
LALVAIVENLGIAMLIVIATIIDMMFVIVRLAFHGQLAGAQFSRQEPS